MKDYRRFLLDALLDRYERSRHYREADASRRAVFLRFDRDSFPDYWNDTSADYRLQVHAAVRELSAAGVLAVRWARGAEGHQVSRADLNLERVGEAYRLAGRTPRREREERLAGVARAWLARWEGGPAAAAAPWLAEVPRRVLAALAGGGGLPFGLGPDDAVLLEKLCRVLDGLAALREEVPARIFSQRVLGDTKALAAVEGRLRRVLREVHPAAGEYDDPDELLADLGLVANPQHVYVSGPVALEHEGGVLDLGRFDPDVGLPAGMIPAARVVRLEAERVVTVENLTAFYRYIAARPRRTLLVYLGGYHNRVRRLWLERLAGFARLQGRAVEFLHWGDIDLGGFRIFAHLRRRTGLPLRPLLMDRETYLVHAERGMPFDDRYARQLAALLEDAEYAPFHDVIAEMLRLRRRVEQESVPPPD